MSGSAWLCSSCVRRLLPLTNARQLSRHSLRTLSQPRCQPIRRIATIATEKLTSTAEATLADEVDDGDASIAAKKQAAKLERAVNKQLEYLEDPWKIGNYVEDALSDNRFDEALLLTQKASKDQQVVVSWNHLIGYSLEQQQVRKAIRIYNEMKKRAQLPNAQTYTVMFRGLAKSQHPKTAVAEAVKHYNLLLRDTRLEPNTIHLNAVLNVCARALDIESMFLIAESVNEGVRSPTSSTYTTIINALRHSTLHEGKDLPIEQRNANVVKAVERCKGLWKEVMQKWSTGKVSIDEELVCSMGRILYLSPNRADKKQITDLMEQTMGLPNFLKSDNGGSTQNESGQQVQTRDNSRGPAKRGAYVAPGRNTLALILTMLSSCKETKAGMKYWNIIVNQHEVVPDMDNWLRLLGLCKVGKNSAFATSTVELIPDDLINYRHFRVAMEACERDNINPNVMTNSDKVIDSMLKRLTLPDMHSLRLHLHVALVSHYQFRKKAAVDGKDEEAKRDYGKQIILSLGRLWEPFKILHYHYFKTVKSKNSAEEKVLYNDKREVIALARHMISAFNKVINEQMLPDGDLREIRPVAAKINREIQGFYADREDREPKLRRGVESEMKDKTNEDLEAHEDGADSLDELQGRGPAPWITYLSARISKVKPEEKPRYAGRRGPQRASR